MSAQFQLPCANCDQSIPVAAKHAGGKVKCVSCQQVMDVPKLGVLRQYEEKRDAVEPPSPERNRLRGMLFSAGLILAVLAGAGAAGLISMANSRFVDVNVEAEIEKTLENFDKLTPAQLLDEWNSRPTDLGDWQEFDFVRQNREAKVLYGFAYGLLAVAGVGLLLLLSSFLVRGKSSSVATSAH